MKVAKNFLVIFKRVMRLEKRVVDDDLALLISRYMKIGMGESRKIPEPIRDELVGIKHRTLGDQLGISRYKFKSFKGWQPQKRKSTKSGDPELILKVRNFFESEEFSSQLKGSN